MFGAEVMMFSSSKNNSSILYCCIRSFMALKKNLEGELPRLAHLILDLHCHLIVSLNSMSHKLEAILQKSTRSGGEVSVSRNNLKEAIWALRALVDELTCLYLAWRT